MAFRHWGLVVAVLVITGPASATVVPDDPAIYEPRSPLDDCLAYADGGPAAGGATGLPAESGLDGSPIRNLPWAGPGSNAGDYEIFGGGDGPDATALGNRAGRDDGGAAPVGVVDLANYQYAADESAPVFRLPVFETATSDALTLQVPDDGRGTAERTGSSASDAVGVRNAEADKIAGGSGNDPLSEAEAVVLPEPATLALMGTGLVMALVMRRRR